ncbi:MAG: hypothetical protein IIA55_12590 [Gemmatimonadetes bacterium]|nr:hypothetical protein [Gemmatimonadota bacterium]
MVRFLGVLFLLGIVGSTNAFGQAPSPSRAIGFHWGANVGTVNHPNAHRLGVQYVVTWFGPLEFYPAFEVFLDRPSGLPFWQALLNVRVRPLGQHGAKSVWYIGAGAVLQSVGIGSGLLSGVEVRVRQLRPFIEVRYYGRNILNGDGAPDFIVGVNFPLR